MRDLNWGQPHNHSCLWCAKLTGNFLPATVIFCFIGNIFLVTLPYPNQTWALKHQHHVLANSITSIASPTLILTHQVRMAEFRNTFVVRNRLYQNQGPAFDQFVLADNSEPGALHRHRPTCSQPVYMLANVSFNNFDHQAVVNFWENKTSMLTVALTLCSAYFYSFQHLEQCCIINVFFKEFNSLRMTGHFRHTNARLHTAYLGSKVGGSVSPIHF